MRRAHRCSGTAEPAPGLLRPSPRAKPPAIRPRDMMIWLPVGLSALLLSGAVFLQRRRRRTRLARFRAEWGQAPERERDMSQISLYHRTPATPDECPLDERTGSDLDLDAVFAMLDRTESAVGQQLLYHRFRTTPTSDNLTARSTRPSPSRHSAAAHRFGSVLSGASERPERR